MDRCTDLVFYLLAALLLSKTVTAQNDPTNVACTVLSSSSLQLTWTRPSNTAVNGYHISVERVDGIINDTSVPNIELSSYTYISYTFHGLANYAQYNLSIHSYIGLTNYTDVFTTCTTEEDAPNGAPLNLNCTAISVSEITCTWDALAQSYWNGVLQGYRLQWLGENVSQIFAANVSTSVFEYTASSLGTDTRYIFMLCGFTAVNYGTVYSTDVETTLGAIIKPVENVTRYYCYEAVPGMIEISWEEMPCTVYTGTIMGLMFVTLILTLVMCCQCCNKAGPGGVEINVMNGPSRGHSGRSHGSFDDDNSTTETDAGDVLEHDLSDDEHQDDKESDMRESGKSTPSNYGDLQNNDDKMRSIDTGTRNSSILDHAEAGLSDSDYSSDMDDEPNKSKKTGVKRGIRLHTIPKGKVVTTTVINPDGRISSNTQFTRTASKAESQDDYEDWDPDNVGKSGENQHATPHLHSGQNVVLATNHDNRQDKERKAENGAITPNNEVVERSVSVSSILVDTLANAYDSIWSPDITENTNPKNQPIQNGIFRSKSTASRKDIPLAVKAKSKISTKTNVNIADKDVGIVQKLEEKTGSHEIDACDKMDNINLDDHQDSPEHKSDTNDKRFTTSLSTPAWLSQRQRDEIRQATNKTPIQEVNIRQSTVIDIEPILGTDRLGKKFPFLNLDQTEQEVKKKKLPTPFRTNAWSRSGKTTKVPKALRNVLQKGASKDVAVHITDDIKVNDASKATNSSGDIKTENEQNQKSSSKESKGQLFYGFGVSRFRKMAAGWLNKMRMKKKLDLPSSKWD